MITILLAALSASAAAGIRIALPLLIIGLLQSDNLWSDIPLLSRVQPQVLLSVLTSWSLFELFGSKQFLGRRILQLVQLGFSPLVGGLMGVAVAKLAHATTELICLVAVVGGLLAFVLQLVQVGWFFRLRNIPIWIIFLEDVLCVGLVFFAFNAPEQGGLIAFVLLWLAIRSSKVWHQWYQDR